MSYIGIIITYVFIQNFILVQFMGLCPFIGVSKNSESAIGMGKSFKYDNATEEGRYLNRRVELLFN